MLKKQTIYPLIIALLWQGFSLQAFAGSISVNSSGDNIDVIQTKNDVFNLKKASRFNGSHGVSEFMGNFQYSYPVALTPGRNNLTPSIDLSYLNSRRNVNSIAGVGWDFNLPKIERYSETGAIEDLYTENNFISHFAGGNGKINSSTGVTLYGEYTPKVINSKIKHEFLANNTWKITDASGTVYLLGASADARIQSEDGTKLHAWFLSSVTDTNGNQIAYEYLKIQGNPYLKRITYGNEIQPFEVRFEPYFSGNITEINALPSYSRQFPVVEQRELLDSIEVFDPFSGDKLVYEFTYESREGINFLTQIQKKGIDSLGTITTENPTTFDYNAYMGECSFTPTLPVDASIYARMWFHPNYEYAVNALYTDYNGDGWIDILSNYVSVDGDPPVYTYYDEVYLNQKNGTWLEVDLPEPNDIPKTLNTYDRRDNIFNFTTSLDLNGDNLQEFYTGKTYHQRDYDAYIPQITKNSLSENLWGKLGDVNGDGLLDVFLFGDVHNLSFGQVSKNTGTGWQTETLTFPTSFNNNKADFLENGSILIQDLNGDGLDDIFIMEQNVQRDTLCQTGTYEYSYKNHLLLNDGNNNFIDVSEDVQFPGFNYYSYQFLSRFFTCQQGDLKFEDVNTNNINFFDFNRDGLVDIHNTNTSAGWQYNNGNGWGEHSFYPSGSNFYGGTYAFGGGETVDLNYDGVLDQVIYRGRHDGEKSIRQNVYPDFPVLTKIDEPLGKKIEVEYTPASGYLDASNNQLNPDLPLAHLTASKITQDDGLGNVSTTSYTYSGGKLYHPEIVRGHQKRELLGFANVEKTLPDNSKVISAYLQGNESTNFVEKGLLTNSKIYQDENTLLQETENFYQTYERETDGFQTQLIKQLQTIYAASDQNNKVSTASQYTYDSNGNLTREINWGKVVLDENEADGFLDLEEDKITTEIQYATNTTSHIYALTSQTETKDFTNNTIARQKIYYDDATVLGEVSKGNPTKNTALQSLNPLREISTETTYNTYGMPLTFQNARGYITTTTYDTHNLYPQKITNAKGHATNYVYNYLFGKVVEVIDPNGAKQKTVFDGLGRASEQQVSNPENSQELVTTANLTYNYSSIPVSIETKTYPGHDNLEVLSKTYLDGFERTIQTSIETEGVDQYVTTRTVYDARGNVKKQLLPQTYSNTLFKSNTAGKPSTDYTYDGLKRPLTVSNSLGTASTVYLPLETQSTDANGKRKDYLSDVRGNLIQVKEYLDGLPYNTNYSYDTAGNLIKIQDAELNEKSFTYDLFGRKLNEELLHKPDDLSPASYAYTYDDNGNILSLTDPKNQVVNYVYDELDRLTTETFNTQTQASYTYDQGNYGTGRLVTVATPDLTKNFAYDVLGRISTETKTIDLVDYVTAFSYDLLGKPQTMIYPEGSVVSYIYNNANFLESINLGSGALVTNFDYAPNLSVSRIDYANGVSTVNTYDENQLHRLTKKLTTKGVQKLQDLNYTFDPIGNITQINDVSDTQTAKTAVYAYDDLHRLTSATITNTANTQDYTRSYAYSLTGNVLNKSDLGNYLYTAKHPQAVSQAGSQNFAYDLNGNLTTDGVFRHVWDYKNRLTSSTASGTTVDYVYDEGSTRVKKVSSGTTVTYVSKYFELDGETPKVHVYANDLKVASGEPYVATVTGSVAYEVNSEVCDLTATGTWVIDENCLLDEVVSVVGDVVVESGAVLTVGSGAILEIDFLNQKLSVESGSTLFVELGGFVRNRTSTGAISTPFPKPYTVTGSVIAYRNLMYHHSDHLTGANVETDVEGNVVELIDYYPYGDMRFDERVGDYENNYKFTGQELDSETDLYYYGARYYDAEVGRFVSIDPWFGDLSDPQSLNKYAYVLNNPLKYVDPTGMYNVETGEIEEGDTADDIVDQVNEAFGIDTDWETIADISFFSTTNVDELVGEYTYVNLESTADITNILNDLNNERAMFAKDTDFNLFDLTYMFMIGGGWDIKNSGDEILGGGIKNRKYWSYIFDGDLIRYDAPGNINYGYVSGAIGVSQDGVRNGAVFEQFIGDTVSSIKEVFSGKSFEMPSFKDNQGDLDYALQGYDLYNP